MYNGPANRLNV